MSGYTCSCGVRLGTHICGQPMEPLDVEDLVLATIRRVQERLEMREVADGPVIAYSKRSVRDVLHSEAWSTFAAEYARLASPPP